MACSAIANRMIMMKRIAALALLGSLAWAGFALPAQAGQDLPAGLARQIDAHTNGPHA